MQRLRIPMKTVSSLLLVGLFSSAPTVTRGANVGLLDREPERELRTKGWTHILGVDEAGRGCLAGPVVAAAVVSLDPDLGSYISAVDDSKKMSARKRDAVFEEIMADSSPFTRGSSGGSRVRLTGSGSGGEDVRVDWGVGTRYAWAVAEVSHARIDKVNILAATMEAMSLCTREIVARGRLPAEDVYAIFDGNTTPPPGGAGGGLEHLALQSWIKGDAHVYPCALASVLAKVADSHGTDPGPWLTVHGCWLMAAEAHTQWPEYNFAQHKGYPTTAHVEAIRVHGACPIHRMTFKPLKGR